MSTKSKVVLGLSCVVSAGIVFYVHYKQNADRERMHQGVVRDIEIQEMKKRQNILMLEQQTAITQMLREQGSNSRSS